MLIEEHIIQMRNCIQALYMIKESTLPIHFTFSQLQDINDLARLIQRHAAIIDTAMANKINEIG